MNKVSLDTHDLKLYNPHMNQILKDWITALCTNEYSQLVDSIIPNTNNITRWRTNTAYCVAGVLVDILAIQGKVTWTLTDDNEYGFNIFDKPFITNKYQYLASKAGLLTEELLKIMEDNDEGKAFEDIANQLEILKERA